LSFQEHFCTLDLETLGSRDDAVILSAGLTWSRYDDQNLTFDKLVSEGLYVKFDIKEQLDKGRVTQDRVVKWWYNQTPEARAVLRPDPSKEISLYRFPDMLYQFLARNGLTAKKIDWYDRKSFDMSKIQYLYEEELKMDIPWNPNQEFEVSTALRYMGMDRYGGIQVKDIPGAIYHHALHDAAVDHIRLSRGLHSLAG
jgi:hypothetical protein